MRCLCFLYAFTNYLLQHNQLEILEQQWADFDGNASSSQWFINWLQFCEKTREIRNNSLPVGKWSGKSNALIKFGFLHLQLWLIIAYFTYKPNGNKTKIRAVLSMLMYIAPLCLNGTYPHMLWWLVVFISTEHKIFNL